MSMTHGMLTRTDALPWRDRAACRGANPEIFYPTDHQPSDDRPVARARRICCWCPVRSECLAAADDCGIWGGLTPAERQGLDQL